MFTWFSLVSSGTWRVRTKLRWVFQVFSVPIVGFTGHNESAQSAPFSLIAGLVCEGLFMCGRPNGGPLVSFFYPPHNSIEGHRIKRPIDARRQQKKQSKWSNDPTTHTQTYIHARGCASEKRKENQQIKRGKNSWGDTSLIVNDGEEQWDDRSVLGSRWSTSQVAGPRLHVCFDRSTEYKSVEIIRHACLSPCLPSRQVKIEIAATRTG